MFFFLLWGALLSKLMLYYLSVIKGRIIKVSYCNYYYLK